MTISHSSVYDATPFSNVMIDIETMSLHKHKALILSVGMLEFDPSPLNAPRFGARLLLVPDVREQLALGRRVDPGTQEFWKKQSPAAAAHWRNGSLSGDNAKYTLDLVRDFCAGKDRVWANGTQFDLCNLEGLADDIGEKNLWHYQAPRDMRTFCRETPATRLMPIGDALDIPGVPHDPIYDCFVQSWQVWAHYCLDR